MEYLGSVEPIGLQAFVRQRVVASQSSALLGCTEALVRGGCSSQANSDVDAGISNTNSVSKVRLYLMLMISV